MGAVISSPRLNCPTALGLLNRAKSYRIPHCVAPYTTLPRMVQLKLRHRDCIGFASGHSCAMDSSFRIVLLNIDYDQFGPNLYSSHDCLRSSLKTYLRKNFILYLPLGYRNNSCRSDFSSARCHRITMSNSLLNFATGREDSRSRAD